MAYFVVRAADGAFTFTAPWGEPMVARPGDAIVRDPRDPADTYRIAAAAFACTYEILRRGALSRYCRTMGSARINALFESWIMPSARVAVLPEPLAEVDPPAGSAERWPERLPVTSARRPTVVLRLGRQAAACARSSSGRNPTDGSEPASPLLRALQKRSARTLPPTSGPGRQHQAHRLPLIVTGRTNALRLILGNNI